jgi:penicillin-binding protein 2
MKNTHERRKYVIIAVFIAVGIIYIIRLFLLQVLESEYRLSADNNVLRYVTQYPPRGLIYDRNGKLMVYNEAAYDLMIIPGQVKGIDTVEFCELLNIAKEDFLARLEKAKKYSYYKPSIFLEQISKEDFGYLEEKLYKFQGFYSQLRTLREYPMPIAAHILGYVGEVNQANLDKDPYYRQGDYIGKSGIEKTYESILRGHKGMNIVMVDVYNRAKGSFQEGKYDTAAISGKDIQLTIDAELQAFGELLMRNKKGSIVAIEPATGEILALVSSPAYDPNLLIGRVRSKNFRMLSSDSLIPLFNRATMAQYPPGSTFKTINALISLQDGDLKPYTEYPCKGEVTRPIPCSHTHHSPLDLYEAIEQSCNPYFWNVYRNMLEGDKYTTIQEGYDHWREQVIKFGIGHKLDSDLPDQRSGNLPSYTYFDKYYGTNGWKAITVRSLSIGQGEVELTPLQLANLSAILANRGYYYSPHLLANVEGDPELVNRFSTKHEVPIDKKYFDIVAEGMHLVYRGEMGSARWYTVADTTACGKTGTSQNPHGKNHSIFIGFAPKDNPEIAIAVVVENSGYGSTWAAPIASIMMEKYLAGSPTQSWYLDKMMNANLLAK